MIRPPSFSHPRFLMTPERFIPDHPRASCHIPMIFLHPLHVFVSMARVISALEPDFPVDDNGIVLSLSAAIERSSDVLSKALLRLRPPPWSLEKLRSRLDPLGRRRWEKLLREPAPVRYCGPDGRPRRTRTRGRRVGMQAAMLMTFISILW